MFWWWTRHILSFVCNEQLLAYSHTAFQIDKGSTAKKRAYSLNNLTNFNNMIRGDSAVDRGIIDAFREADGHI